MGGVALAIGLGLRRAEARRSARSWRPFTADAQAAASRLRTEVEGFADLSGRDARQAAAARSTGWRSGSSTWTRWSEVLQEEARGDGARRGRAGAHRPALRRRSSASPARALPRPPAEGGSVAPRPRGRGRRRRRAAARRCCPTDGWAWSPGTHIFLGQAVLANLAPAARPPSPRCSRPTRSTSSTASIAADTSFAKKYVPVGPPQPLVARRRGDPRAGGHRAAARLRLRLPGAPRRRRRGAQLLRAAPAGAHLVHPRPRATPTGRRGSTCTSASEYGAHRATRSSPSTTAPATSTSTASSRRRSSACAPTAGSSAGWCSSPT